jgi:hypothetical protein
MRKLRLAKTDFTAGELDPLLLSREDIKAFAKGLARLRNWTQLDSGAIRRRPGSKYIDDLLADTILKPFAFGQDQDYVFAFSNTRADIYNADTEALATSVTGAPWATSQLTRLYTAQSADTMIVCHPDMAMQRILRTGASSFTLSDFTFESNSAGTKTYQPYYKFADDAVTLTPSAITGTGVTLTASSSVFSSDHNGTILRYKEKEILITGYTSGTVLTGTVREKLPGNITAVDTTAETLTVTAHGYETGESTTYTSGGTLIGGLTSATVYYIIKVDADTVKLATSAANAIAGTSINLTGTGDGTLLGSVDWEEQVFSDVRGYANTAIFHEGRLWFCGTKSLPSHVFGSKVDAFFNFDVGTGLDDESIQVAIRSEQIGEIRGVASLRHLQIFTDQAEFYVPSSENHPLTPAAFSVQVQTRYGSGYVTPQPFDGATLYVQKGGKAIREFLYRDTEAAYSSGNVSILAPHLIISPVDMAVLYGSETRPEQYAYIVNSDGTMAQFHSIRDEAVAGFALWDTDGLYKSVCVVGNKLFVAVQRTLDSVSTRTLEVFEDDRALDCSLDGTSVSATVTFTDVVPHLANMDVQVVSGNLYLGEFTAGATGTVVVEDEVTEMTAGLDYTPNFTTLPVASALNDGSLLGEIVRLVKCVMVLDTTVECVVNSQRLIIRQVTDDLSEDPTPFTGRKEFTLRGYSRDGQFSVEQEVPLTITVLGFNLEVAV